MQRLHDIKKTQLQLVQDRNYQISPEEMAILTMSLREFVQYVNSIVISRNTSVRGALSYKYTSTTQADGTRRSMLVYYAGKMSPQKQISAEVVREFNALAQQHAVYEAILIVDAPLSSTANEELKALTLIKHQIFNDSDLSHNPTHHVDTTRHELLSPQEKEAKLREMRTDISKLSIMRENDPICRYYGWPVGGLVRVHRDDSAISILAPKSINYRIIVGN